jgi:hypothetical protein
MICSKSLKNKKNREKGKFNLIEKIAIPTNSKIAGKKIYQLIKGIDSNAPIKFLSSSSSNDEKKTMSKMNNKIFKKKSTIFRKKKIL